MSETKTCLQCTKTVFIPDSEYCLTCLFHFIEAGGPEILKLIGERLPRECQFFAAVNGHSHTRYTLAANESTDENVLHYMAVCETSTDIRKLVLKHCPIDGAKYAAVTSVDPGVVGAAKQRFKKEGMPAWEKTAAERQGKLEETLETRRNGR